MRRPPSPNGRHRLSLLGTRISNETTMSCTSSIQLLAQIHFSEYRNRSDQLGNESSRKNQLEKCSPGKKNIVWKHQKSNGKEEDNQRKTRSTPNLAWVGCGCLLRSNTPLISWRSKCRWVPQYYVDDFDRSFDVE